MTGASAVLDMSGVPAYVLDEEGAEAVDEAI